jgi:hypothetical protein
MIRPKCVRNLQWLLGTLVLWQTSALATCNDDNCTPWDTPCHESRPDCLKGDLFDQKACCCTTPTTSECCAMTCSYFNCYEDSALCGMRIERQWVNGPLSLGCNATNGRCE